MQNLERQPHGRTHMALKQALTALIVPPLMLILLELLNQQTPANLIHWMTSQPLVALWSLISMYAGYLGLWLLMSHALPATILFCAFWTVAGVVNHYMFVFRGEVLLPRDVLNWRAALSIVPNLTITITWQAVVCVLVAIGAMVVVWRLHLKRIKLWKWPVRVVAGLLVLAIPVLMVADTWSRRSYLNQVLDENPGSQSTSVVQYRTYGFQLATAINLKSLMVEKPYLYSQKSVERLAEFDNYSYEPVDAPENPNIIVVMDESWSDGRLLNDNLVYNDDPFAPLESVESGSLYKGNLLVSVYGGNTCNSEFEFLTGSSTVHLPLGTLPYQHYIKDKKVYGLTSLLKDLGYQAYAVHSYTRNFWHRDTVYPLMGFDEFYAEDDFEDPELKYQYISDQDVFEKICEVYEERDADKPFFCFAVTMQNHGTYRNPETARDYDLTIDQELSEAEMMELKTYTAGVKDAAQLGRDLIDYFAQTGEPTIVLIFGDHHPRLAAEPTQAGMEGAPEDEGEYLMAKYTTPYYIWTSYETEFDEPETLGISFLSSHLLRYAGIDASNYFKLVYEASRSIDAMNPYVLKTASGEILQNPNSIRTPDIAETLKNLKLLQYDMIFGEQYAKDLFYETPGAVDEAG